MKPSSLWALVGILVLFVLVCLHVQVDGVDIESTTAMFMIIFAFGWVIGMETRK